MKPIALATVALLASTPAAAQTLKLPNEMLGTWCPTQDPLVEEKDGTSTIKYERRQDCSPADDTSIVLGPRGYGGQDVSCKAISGVTRSPPFLQVRYRCTGEGNITLNVRWRLIGLQLVWNSRVPRWEAAERFDKYECQVTEVVENLSTRKPKTLTPKDDLVLIEVAKNPPRMKVSHIDKKGEGGRAQQAVPERFLRPSLYRLYRHYR
jgi:hypothetical protein